ncbi:chorismate mutase aro7 [Podila verticillata]|nr:chorismate mutase aro7 [Podila verticillata]
MTTKLLDTEAQSTISQPGGRNQQCRKEAYPYVDTQSEVGKASVAGAEPAPGRPPNLSKKLLSPLASDPHPSQDPGVSVLNRGSLHTKGSNRLSEVEQLQIWTIKNTLIERAQFKLNASTYQCGVYDYENGYKGSFLGYFLHEMEKVHSRVRRYTSPDEYPFTQPLPTPILPDLEFPPTLHTNNINVNIAIMDRYLQDIVPKICSAGDDLNYGSSATRDVECLQALSKRIHYGKFIAEAKFMDPTQQAIYIRLIKAKDREGIMELLTNRTVEAALLRRLRRKAMIYGHDITENGDIVLDQETHDKKISPDVVVDLYERFVIPLTKEVEVQYLLQRLDGWQAPVSTGTS